MIDLPKLQLQIKKEQMEKYLRRGKIQQPEFDDFMVGYNEATRQPFRSAQGSKSTNADPKPPTTSVKTKEYAPTPITPGSEKERLLMGLKKEQAEVDTQKALLSNSLQDYPTTTNVKDITDRILGLRELWSSFSDKIIHVMEHGILPNEAPILDPEFERALPSDKFELDKAIRNLRSNISKWRKAFNAAKTEAKKQGYTTRLAHGEMKMDAMETKFKSL